MMQSFIHTGMDLNMSLDIVNVWFYINKIFLLPGISFICDNSLLLSGTGAVGEYPIGGEEQEHIDLIWTAFCLGHIQT